MHAFVAMNSVALSNFSSFHHCGGASAVAFLFLNTGDACTWIKAICLTLSNRLNNLILNHN